MGTRGPKNQYEKMAQVADVSIRRPSAPTDLSEHETEVWARVVGSLPPDWFRPSQFDLLEMYCRHAGTAAVLSDEIDRWEPEWIKQEDGLKQYRSLLAARAKETQSMATIATKLRMTHQAIDKKISATKAYTPGASTGRKLWDYPWKVDEENEDDD